MSYQYKTKGYMMNKVFDRLEATPEGVSWTELHIIYKDVTNGSNSLSYNLQNWLSLNIFRKDGRYICRDTRDPNTGRRIYKVCRKPLNPMLDRLFSLHKKLRLIKSKLSELPYEYDAEHLRDSAKMVAMRIGECKVDSSRRYNHLDLIQLNNINRLYNE